MSKTKRRLQVKRRVAEHEARGIGISNCPKCGEKGKHFFPPSLGDSGFYICKVNGVEG